MAAQVTRSSKTTDQGCGYRLIREAGPLELLAHLYHDLGIQSNVLVFAEYTKYGQIMTKSKVLKALAVVINDESALSIIGVSQPSEKEGNHRLWEARLPALRIQDCVEFLDIQGNLNPSQVFENAHNQWFDTKDATKPWWKVIIINGRYAVFVFHHSIGDGLSGYAFHRSFLAALNANEALSETMSEITTENTFAIHQPAKMPSASPFDHINDKVSWIYVIYSFLFWSTMRFFVNQKHFLFSDAVFSKEYPTFDEPFPVETKSCTKVEILRIDSEVMTRCLAKCRKHNTSFTALIHTLIQVTLAADIYPNAKFGFSRLAVNLRPMLKVDPGRDVFTNTVSTYYRVQKLGRYRACARGRASPSASSPIQEMSIDAPKVWELARTYKRDLKHATYKSGTVMQDFLISKILEGDMKDVSFFGHGLYQNNSFLISNLGVFELRENMFDGGWSIKDIGFSAGAIRAILSDCGIAFNVASVKEKDCLISAIYEEGVLKDEMVKKELIAVLERIKLLI